MREYRYLPAEGVTFGVDVQDGQARVAMTACNEIDPFSPGTGKDLVDLLFDKGDSTLRACSLKRNVVKFPYDGDRPRKDVLKPLINHLTDELGERGFFRALMSYYESGIVSNKDAVAVSRELEDESIYLDYARMMEHLDEDEQELFAGVTSEEELYQLFFPWQGSTSSLVRKMRSFATAVWSKELVLGTEEEEKQPTRRAPRKSYPQPEVAVKSYTTKSNSNAEEDEEEVAEEENDSQAESAVATSSNNG